jgi:hypothetical protein
MDVEHEYDICLSFAGEQRPYVEQVAEILHQQGFRVFYDAYEQVNLWGKDLYEHLDLVYRKSARYCVLFASAEYAAKIWTTHERRSLQARALIERLEYVLPARFDDTEIPGLRPTIGYVDLRRTTPVELAQLIAKKLDTGPSRSHQYAWPSMYSGLVWIWVRPVPVRVGQDHKIHLRWGPWRRTLTSALQEAGLTLVTGKAGEDVAALCQVEVTPPARVVFGVGEVADRPVRDIGAGWTRTGQQNATKD